MSHAHAKSGNSSSRSKQSLRAWLRMLSCTTLIERRLRTRLRETFDVTLPQFDVLAELDRAGKAQTMSELSRQLMVSNGNVTGVVDRLERSGLVRRTASQTDRRVLYIELTEVGRQAFAGMARMHEEWVDAMLAELVDGELLELTELLNRAKQSVKSPSLMEVED